jgi:hypothetical protein
VRPLLTALVPSLLIVLAAGAAASVALGTHPSLAEYPRGLQLIMLARRIEWPLVTVALVLSLALLALVISGKRRAWWLAGLAPVLLLFVHRFGPDGRPLRVLESPVFVAPPGSDPTPRPESRVVGLVFQDQPYALPYSALYSTPVVFITDYDKRMLLMWSAHANRAVAFSITRELKARDLEIVSTPGDTLLVLNRRLGQFIVAVTGRTVDGTRPVGFGHPIRTIKTTWAAWSKLHPTTKVLLGRATSDEAIAPILPRDAGKALDGMAYETPIVLIETDPPIALELKHIKQLIRNTTARDTRILIVHDATTERLRAFDRHVMHDLFVTFEPSGQNAKHPNAFLVDRDTRSIWTIDGRAVDGPLKGSQLKELPIDSGLYWGVMKRWYPQLELAEELGTIDAAALHRRLPSHRAHDAPPRPCLEDRESAAEDHDHRDDPRRHASRSQRPGEQQHQTRRKQDDPVDEPRQLSLGVDVALQWHEKSWLSTVGSRTDGTYATAFS